MRIRIIGVPSAWGTRELGAQKTPRLLREAGLLDWLSGAGHDVVDGGDVPVPPMKTDDLPPAQECAEQSRRGLGEDGDDGPKTTPRSSIDTAQLARVEDMARGVREAVSEALDAGDLPIVLGGECSLGIGVAAALARHRGPLTVAWLDAHGDLNTPETSVSGLLTGMPLAVMLGHGDEELTAVGVDGARPRGDRTFLLGGRDLDAGEVRNLADFGIRHLDTETIRATGPEEVIMEILDVPEVSVMPPEARAQLIASDPHSAESAAAAPHPSVYLHFDVDVLDPDFGPGVHYRVAGGFDPAEVGTLAGYLCASGCVGAIAVASANLEHDIDGRTVASIRRVLSSVADALAAL